MSNIVQTAEKLYVADVIGNEYKHWHDEKVIIDCGTGAGKTHFILTSLAKYAKENHRRVLYLCNRSRLKKQILDDVVKYGLIETVNVMTYQHLQALIKKGEYEEYFHYIIGDECHYFTSDATFNFYTDLSYDYLYYTKNSVVIYMSATATSLFNNLKEKDKVPLENYYFTPRNYSYVDNVYFFKNNEQIEQIIEYIFKNDNESKIICFCNGAEKFIELNQRYGDEANYFCSKESTDTKLKEINQPDCIYEHEDKTNTFDKRLLVTTKVLDNGVDIKDPNVKYIISNIFDLDSAVQCLGRKRILSNDDSCTFYIKDYQKSELNLHSETNRKELEPVRLFKNNYGEFLEKYADREFKNHTIYTDWHGDKLPHINRIRHTKLKLDSRLIQKMQKLSYRSLILDYLGETIIDKVSDEDFSSINAKSILEVYLEKTINQKLFKDEQKKLKEIFESSGLKDRTMGIHTLNGKLKDLELPYKISSKTTKDKDRKNVRYWQIVRNVPQKV